LLILLGLFVAASLLFSYAAWPVLLWPYLDVLSRAPLAGLIGLLPCLVVRSETEEEAQAQPFLLRFFSLTGALDGMLLGAFLGSLLVLAQLAMIRSKPHLTLDHYLREGVWFLWIVILLLGVGYGMLLFAWTRRR
jgi:hypothetical protein